MNPTHTPGPWIVRHLTGFPLMIATAPDGDGFGEPVADCSRHHLPAQAMCNARLIAAAPELLEALRFVGEFHQRNFDAMPVAFETVVSIIDAALARVEGR